MALKRTRRPDLGRASRSLRVPTHRRDISETSLWVRKALGRLGDSLPGVALDIPSGRGRHTRLLLELGFMVVAADLDRESLLETMSCSSSIDALLAVQLDAGRPLPFAPDTFDLVVVIHPHSLDVLAGAQISLRVGGHLILETFGAHGENWRLLPRANQVTEELLLGFDVLVCKESPVAKAPSFVTVKGIFRKRQ
jgi:SAM-dependent methyltransferase